MNGTGSVTTRKSLKINFENNSDIPFYIFGLYPHQSSNERPTFIFCTEYDCLTHKSEIYKIYTVQYMYSIRYWTGYPTNPSSSETPMCFRFFLYVYTWLDFIIQKLKRKKNEKFRYKC